MHQSQFQGKTESNESGVDSEPCTGEQLSDSEKVKPEKGVKVVKDDNSDDQVACSVLRTERRHLSRGLQQGAPQTSKAHDGVILIINSSDKNKKKNKVNKFHVHQCILRGGYFLWQMCLNDSVTHQAE